MKKLGILNFILFLIAITTSCDKKNNLLPTEKTFYTDLNTINVTNLKTDSSGLSDLKAVIKTVHGNITFKFYSTKSPNTTARIIDLIQKGFYDGLAFHRVLPHYIVQTGDPTGSGQGGSDVKIKAEFNEIQHIKGTIAMARKIDDVNSSDSQFYIALTTLPHLDGKYTVFGQVIAGLNILDKIQKDDKILSIVLGN